MSSSFAKIEASYQEGMGEDENYKFVLWTYNSCDRQMLYLNGELILALPNEVMDKVALLLNNESHPDVQSVTRQDLVDIGYIKT